MTIKPQFAIIGLAVGLGAALLLYIWKKGGISSAAQDIGAGAVEAVGGLAGGAVVGVGGLVGIPPTNLSKCEQAIADGRTWDASFDCPAGRFIDYVTSGK